MKIEDEYKDGKKAVCRRADGTFEPQKNGMGQSDLPTARPDKKKGLTRAIREGLIDSRLPRVLSFYDKLLDLRTKKICGEEVKLEHRLAAANKLLDKMIPSLKAVEFEGERDGIANVTIVLSSEKVLPTYRNNGLEDADIETISDPECVH